MECFLTTKTHQRK